MSIPDQETHEAAQAAAIAIAEGLRCMLAAPYADHVGADYKRGEDLLGEGLYGALVLLARRR